MAILSSLKEKAKQAAAAFFSSSPSTSTPPSEFDAGFLGRSSSAIPPRTYIPPKADSMRFPISNQRAFAEQVQKGREEDALLQQRPLAAKLLTLPEELSRERDTRATLFAQGLRQPHSPESAKRLGVAFHPEAQKVVQEELLNFAGMTEGIKSVIKQPAKQLAKTAAQKLFGSPAVKEQPFTGLPDLSTKIVEKMKGKAIVSKQFIQDLTNSGDVKQVERDLIRKHLAGEGDKVDVTRFADKVGDDLLPLEVSKPEGLYADRPKRGMYENITLPEETRGNVANYNEHIFQSPIKTSAGSVHFPAGRGDGTPADRYFGHTRIEDMADGKTRRVIEVQSDLYQKGRLEQEFVASKKVIYKGKEYPINARARDTVTLGDPNNPRQSILDVRNDEVSFIEPAQNKELTRLEQYNDPTAHFRMIREEVKKAAEDGKSELLFPTGETAMKVEGLGQAVNRFVAYEGNEVSALTKESLRIGKTIRDDSRTDWVITDVLGDGKFKALPRDISKQITDLESTAAERLRTNVDTPEQSETLKAMFRDLLSREETFDISGKVDQNNPIYKFYDKEVGKYLRGKYNATQITDDKGVSWWRVAVDAAEAKKPVEAFGLAAGMEPEVDENGRITGFRYDPVKGAVGFAGLSASRTKLGQQFIGKSKEAWEVFQRKEAARAVAGSLKGGTEFEAGYVAFKKIAQRFPDVVGDAVDYDGLVTRLMKSGKYGSRSQVENELMSSAAGGDITNNELLDKFKERFILERDLNKNAALLGSRSYKQGIKRTDEYLKTQASGPEGFGMGGAFSAEEKVAVLERAKEKVRALRTGEPSIVRTQGGYIFKGRELSSLESKPGILEGARRINTQQAPEALPVSPEKQTVLEATEKARQAMQGSGIPSRADPLLSMIDRPGMDVKTKVNILDYLRTPEHVLKKIGLEREGVLLKKKYDDYLRDLPIEINKITDWYKRVPDKDSSARIFKYLDGQEAALEGEELKVANEIRGYLKTWAEKLKLPESNQITHYITHLFDPDIVKKEFDPDIAKLIADRVPGSVYDPFLQKRLGALGYKEDVWQALDAYTKRAVRKHNMDVALEPLQKAANKLDVDSYKYVEALASRVNLRPTAIDNLFDNLIKSTPIGYRLGQRPLAVISTKIRRAVYRGTLGLNVGSALRNLTQGVNTYAELGEHLTLVGYRDFLKSIKEKSTELTDVGVLRDDFIQDRVLNATKEFWQKTDKGLFALFESAEKINRGAAYFGAKAKALKAGKNELEAIEYAKKIVEKTQFRFGSVDTPVALQSDLAKIFTQFQSFNVKQTEFLAGKVQKKEWAGLIRYALGSALLVGSVGEMIGLSPTDMIPFSGVAQGKTKLGETPPVRAIGAIMSALFNAPDRFGKARSGLRKLEDVGSTLIPFIPGGVQGKKLFGGIQAIRSGKVEVREEGRKGTQAIETPWQAAKSLLLGPRSITGDERERLKKYDAIADSLKLSHDKVKSDFVQALTDGTDDELDRAMDSLATFNEAVIDSIDDGVNQRVFKFGADKEYKAMIQRYQVNQKDIQAAIKKLSPE